MEVRPYSFAQVSEQKTREIDTKESTRKKKSVYLPPILQNYVYEYSKKSRLFPAFLFFNTGSGV